MGLAASIPGMQPGHPTRNLAMAAGYVILFPLLLAGFIIALPFAVAYAVGKNRNGVAEKLDVLPGVSSSGGAVAGVAALIYVFVAMGVLGAILPGADQTGGPTNDSSLAGDGGPNASTDGGMTAVSPTATGTAPLTSTDGNQQRDDTDGGDSEQSGVTATPTPTTQPQVSSGERTATVLRVVDGDTLKVRLDNGSEDTVRLLGVDTPEVHAENTPDEWEGVPNSEAGDDCLRQEGHDASDWVKGQLADETIRLEFDENEGKRGYYGRLLAYVYLDGQHVNYQLVDRGLARVYDSSFERRSSFYAAESDAQAAEIGAWRCRNVETSTPTPTASSSGSGGELSVARVHADAEGNDHENENDEYIVFENTGDSALDLSGWRVSDEADHDYRIPSGFTLEAGATVTLYTGSGQNSESELYWGSNSAIWNNDGDTVYVDTDSGKQVIAHEY